MDLTELRRRMDDIDQALIQLFTQRMEIAAQIGEYKRQHGLPVYDPAREREKRKAMAQLVPPELRNDTQTLFSMLFELSRNYQQIKNSPENPLYEQITQAIADTPSLFPQSPVVACQGVEGAYSQIACEKIFKHPEILYFKSFDGVFQALDQGLCQYGILPIENSTAGSVNKVYDLMIRHRFSIVRTFRLKIDHDLLANPGTRLEDIKEIYSHEQALSQCQQYLSGLPGVKVIPVANTAAAAQMVASSGRTDAAAISSRVCAQLYGLKRLAQSIQDKGNNRTRFICISKKLEIYPGADRTSVMMILPHHPGALYMVLARLYSLGINVTKLESRPLPDREFEFMFYFDLETSVYSQSFAQLICQLSELCEQFQYLGSYTEVI